MQGGGSNRPAPTRPGTTSDIAQQPQVRQPAVPEAVRSCNRLGRMANPPRFAGFRPWWRRRADRGR
jgi:hypothetical protein